MFHNKNPSVYISLLKNPPYLPPIMFNIFLAIFGDTI